MCVEKRPKLRVDLFTVVYVCHEKNDDFLDGGRIDITFFRS